jgi:hypothetical protein
MAGFRPESSGSGRINGQIRPDQYPDPARSGRINTRVRPDTTAWPESGDIPAGIGLPVPDTGTGKILVT